MTGIRIQMRRGTAAQWASVNPVLAAGEWGLDTTNKLVKIGDGASTWSQLTVADPKAHAATHASAGGDPVTLAQSQITNLTTDLAGKAASVHSHAQSDVTGLVSDLAGKAASVHSHAQSDVTGLDTALSGKASTTHASTHAPAGSDPLTVAQSQVTGLPADLAARVTGPASSTDNTLPRFDLATGKVLQGSGVTVDDSNNISGLGTIGSGAITSSGAVEAAAASGFVVGASGPRVMSGTGSPEGVVSAPVGSTYIDTAATTGAIKWIKASGTGNTGWKVEYGDTGLRNLAAVSLLNGWTVASSVFQLRRVGAAVEVTAGVNKTAATADTFYTLPVGFRPGIHTYGTSSSATDDYANATLTTGGGLAVSRAYMTVAAHYMTLTFITADAWPSSLPGT